MFWWFVSTQHYSLLSARTGSHSLPFLSPGLCVKYRSLWLNCRWLIVIWSSHLVFAGGLHSNRLLGWDLSPSLVLQLASLWFSEFKRQLVCREPVLIRQTCCSLLALSTVAELLCRIGQRQKLALGCLKLLNSNSPSTCLSRMHLTSKMTFWLD